MRRRAAALYALTQKGFMMEEEMGASAPEKSDAVNNAAAPVEEQTASPEGQVAPQVAAAQKAADQKSAASRSAAPAENQDKAARKKAEKQLKAWRKERELIPVMIRAYCHAKHGTKGKAVCEECRALTEYALFRLDKCPFKVNKKFCSFCKIHCYKPDMREKIKDVMKFAGPRMLPTHPVFAFKHVFQMISYKRKLRSKAKAKKDV